ncbi:Ldh family oxidoreductase [Marinomonas pollencensis]|uniref:LDH2 family malate/lactate/ureidoglycolate dehydrogenase n=1 Tax=Marinomonas pollencensis TaxID=491954 RepID=A0A3E0DM26_9GAMM|nr:Ldh family oxidoreductase [Marinomonas pollencensis]REG83834.1 LDH2 family malate/lactate/ureidoglycolate dehydrogenase [Marinomonas pollencensis]
MSDNISLSLAEMRELSENILIDNGFSKDHAKSITDVMAACQQDDCHSHGLFRLFMCTQSMKLGRISGSAQPDVIDAAPSVVRANANGGISLLALDAALPLLIEKTKKNGIAALAINHCYHFSALWPEVEKLSAVGLAGLAMVPSHAWVAPAGGKRGTLGTNPLAFSWPRPGQHPFTFDFATSQFARGEIELYRRAGKPLPEGVAIDKEGQPTTDAEAAMAGAMMTFGGYKGSALSIMIELLAGPLIDDLTSKESMEAADGQPEAPYHGEIIIAFDPNLFSAGKAVANNDRAERLFADIIDQGARLPSQRRYQARERNLARNAVEIPRTLYNDLLALRK